MPLTPIKPASQTVSQEQPSNATVSASPILSGTPTPETHRRASSLRRPGSRYGKLGLNLNLSINGGDNELANSTLNNQTPRHSYSPSHSTSSSITNPIMTPDNHIHQSSHTMARSNSISKASNASTTPLPTADALEQLEITDQLRLLALKEMAVVELKDQLKNITSNIQKQEQELHKLREIIQKSLYKELKSTDAMVKNSTSNPSPASSNIYNNPRDAAIASTKKNRRRTLSSSSSLSPPMAQISASPKEEVVASDPHSSKTTSLWGNLSKHIHQLDTIIQSEFEKSLFPTNSNEVSTSTHQQHRATLSQDSFGSMDSVNTNSTTSPLKGKKIGGVHRESVPNQPINQPIKDLASRQEDMIQTVSSHIWSFVSDVKQNLLVNEKIASQDNSPAAPTFKHAQEATQGVELINFDLTDTTLSGIDLDPTIYDNENDFEVDLNFYNQVRKRDDENKMPTPRIPKSEKMK